MDEVDDLDAVPGHHPEVLAETPFARLRATVAALARAEEERDKKHSEWHEAHQKLADRFLEIRALTARAEAAEKALHEKALACESARAELAELRIAPVGYWTRENEKLEKALAEARGDIKAISADNEDVHDMLDVAWGLDTGDGVAMETLSQRVPLLIRERDEARAQCEMHKGLREETLKANGNLRAQLAARFTREEAKEAMAELGAAMTSTLPCDGSDAILDRIKKGRGK